MSIRSRCGLLAGATALILACDSPTPPQPAGPGEFAFCEEPTVVIARFDEGDWHYPEVVGNRFTIPAGVQRLTVLYRTRDREDGLFVFSLAAHEAPSGGCPRDGFYTGSEYTLTQASVAGLESWEEWLVRIGDGRRSGTGPGSFDVYVTGDDPDLLAFRMFYEQESGDPRRQVILRRSVVPAGDPPALPVLDFGGSESREMPRGSMVVANAPSGAGAVSLLRLARVAIDLDRHYGIAFPNDYYGIPGELLGDGEDHVYAAAAPDGRSVRYFYREANDTTIAMGPLLPSHGASVVANDACFRPRLTFASQSAYPSFGSARFRAYYGGATGNHYEYVQHTVTAAYLGGLPGTWSIEVPRVVMNGVDFCMLSGVPLNWSAENGAGDGRLALLLGFTGEREALRTAGFYPNSGNVPF